MTTPYEPEPQYEQYQQPQYPPQPEWKPDYDIRVRFGPGPDQLMPLSWAEKILTMLLAEQPKRFTALLSRAVLDGQGVGGDVQDDPTNAGQEP